MDKDKIKEMITSLSREITELHEKAKLLAFERALLYQKLLKTN